MTKKFAIGYIISALGLIVGGLYLMNHSLIGGILVCMFGFLLFEI